MTMEQHACKYLLEFTQAMWPKYDRRLDHRISTISGLTDSSFKTSALKYHTRGL